MILISIHLLLVFSDFHAYFNFSVEVSTNISVVFYVQIDVENLYDNFGQTLESKISRDNFPSPGLNQCL